MIEKFKKLGESVGAVLSKHANSIMRLKEKMIDEYSCPCYPDDKDHYCISPLCKSEIDTKGKCHCGLFVKENKDDKDNNAD